MKLEVVKSCGATLGFFSHSVPKVPLCLKQTSKGQFTRAIFGAIFVALSNATFVASVN